MAGEKLRHGSQSSGRGAAVNRHCVRLSRLALRFVHASHRGRLLLIDVIRAAARRWSRAPTAWAARVRWVHVLELADAAHLLQGGELVLTTGVALPANPRCWLATPPTGVRRPGPA